MKMIPINVFTDEEHSGFVGLSNLQGINDKTKLKEVMEMGKIIDDISKNEK